MGTGACWTHRKLYLGRGALASDLLEKWRQPVRQLECYSSTGNVLGRDQCPQFLLDIKNIQITQATDDQGEKNDVRIYIEGHLMDLQRLSTMQQLKELRKPTSLPGFKFGRKGMPRGCDYSYSPSEIYIIHNLSTVNWLPSGKVLLALEGIKPSLLILLGQI